MHYKDQWLTLHGPRSRRVLGFLVGSVVFTPGGPGYLSGTEHGKLLISCVYMTVGEMSLITDNDVPDDGNDMGEVSVW